ncbi:hypothetical protein Anapl_10432 [Anas platyrhynchos]|uniref:Uncharacterized protein n=1 Tax=Anas platyrhynchos TaxID=8839 RepID=R0LMC4_ANAPL|nr:hypothetical protein Anapl_10432 [Anas platyrhynchos]
MVLRNTGKIQKYPNGAFEVLAVNFVPHFTNKVVPGPCGHQPITAEIRSQQLEIFLLSFGFLVLQNLDSACFLHEKYSEILPYRNWKRPAVSLDHSRAPTVNSKQIQSNCFSESPALKQSVAKRLGNSPGCKSFLYPVQTRDFSQGFPHEHSSTQYQLYFGPQS